MSGLWWKALCWSAALYSSGGSAAGGTLLPESRSVRIPAAVYLLGSDGIERQWGYQHSPALVRQQRWYDAWERQPERHSLAAFRIDQQPVTQARYAEFIRARNHRVPFINLRDYLRQGFLVHPYERVAAYIWQGAKPPVGLADHPVVLVSQQDAAAYCQWRGQRLPSEFEWEAACRGTEARRFAWGDQWRASYLQASAQGTAAVDAHPDGATPEGVQDLLGNVFEWSASPMGDGERVVLKGCSWDDAPGTCRCGFRHGRAAQSRHILIGFRCATDTLPVPSTVIQRRTADERER